MPESTQLKVRMGIDESGEDRTVKDSSTPHQPPDRDDASLRDDHLARRMNSPRPRPDEARSDGGDVRTCGHGQRRAHDAGEGNGGTCQRPPHPEREKKRPQQI